MVYCDAMKTTVTQIKGNKATIQLELEREHITFDVTLQLVVNKLPSAISETLASTLPDDDSFPWEVDLLKAINKALGIFGQQKQIIDPLSLADESANPLLRDAKNS